jgi:hypothetical protein
MVRRHSGGSFDDEELVREGGVFVSRGGGREVGADEAGAPGDYVEDPGVDDGVPGTRDDLAYDFGVELPMAADHIIDGPDNVAAGFGGMGRTGSEPDGDEAPLGAPDERELWGKQLSLIDEAEVEERGLSGLEGSDMQRLRDAEADGAEDVLPDFPDGVSATGAT